MLSLLELFDESFARIVLDPSRSGSFFDAFYENFLSDRKGAQTFLEGVEKGDQRHALQSTLMQIASFSTTRFKVHASITALADELRGRGLGEHAYRHWIDALITTVRQQDPLYRRETGQAWRVMMAPGLAFMQLDPDEDAVLR